MFRNGWYVVSGVAIVFVANTIGGALIVGGSIGTAIGRVIGLGLGLFVLGYILAGALIYPLDRFVIRPARFANPETRPQLRNGWYCFAGMALMWVLFTIGEARSQSATTGDSIVWENLALRTIFLLVVYGVLGTLLGGLIYLFHKFISSPHALSISEPAHKTPPFRLSTKSVVVACSIVMLVIVCGFAAFVWPTMYRYDRVDLGEVSYPVRIERLSGKAEVLFPTGWKEWGSPKQDASVAGTIPPAPWE